MTALRGVAVVALAIAVMGTTTASAGTLTRSADQHTLTFTANPGEANDTYLSIMSTGPFFVRDPAPIAPYPPDCTYSDAPKPTVQCPRPGVTKVVVKLGDGNDILQGGYEFGSLPLLAVGGPGNDQIVAAEGTATLNGGAGNDKLSAGGNPGPDTLIGGAGNDTLTALGAKKDGDTFNCGAGHDTVFANRGDHVAANCEKVKRFD